MAESEDVQGTVIGVGTVVAIGLYAYGAYLGGSLFGIDATTLAITVFGATFAALAILHGAYGRQDFALAHGSAALGLFVLAPGSSGPRILAGYLLLLAGGGYVAFVTVRLRRASGTAAK
ncbi:hypothetical protein [Natrarchaeobaculum aegyptiacum]|uniref:Integral membrane protein n=1 Tax=Natrarchaeobaculum aegyptiacum TaxID=745377 RepID=A0A2Z2HYI8_9EURY|nr:hypothetical protein [Natrarchaeobaculum aegyptiacum]ARS91435.1 hypothetical protein B1756_18060 [Natrarchaeobaculum aegyptiacum]